MKKIKRILGWQNLKMAFKGNIVDLPLYIILVILSVVFFKTQYILSFAVFIVLPLAVSGGFKKLTFV